MVLVTDIQSHTFNRTSVELKRHSRTRGNPEILTFNRTSVELKPSAGKHNDLELLTFNRTSQVLAMIQNWEKQERETIKLSWIFQSYEKCLRKSKLREIF